MSAAEPLTVAALVSYDGSDFFGFQVQPGLPTVQGALEQALGTFTTLRGRVTGAGRTDTGVHARGQVVTVSLDWRHDLRALQRAWNAHLPPAVSIRSLIAARAGFHPRFSARSRTYRYTVVEHGSGGQPPLHAPLTERFAHFEPRRLDMDAIAEATKHLVGRHDFRAFGQPPQGESTTRTVFVAEWQRAQDGLAALPGAADSRLVLTITADAFLKHMVRRIAGSLFEVGRGHWTPDGFAEVLASCETSRSAPPAAPNGLVLEWVDYAPEWAMDFFDEMN